MKQYLDLVHKVMTEGVVKKNRTGIDTVGILGAMMQFDMADGFPIVTTKKTSFRVAIAEMLGFLRGYTSAADFRKLGCKVWDKNANENEAWLGSRYRTGTDDLGRIYGAQARGWWGPNPTPGHDIFDQLRMVYDDLRKGIDNRREIVTHWNPAEMDRMSLPPCHLLYQFGIQEGRLCLSMYQRSCDLALGVPFNIVGYAWLLHVMARITGLEPGVFTHFLHDVHIYDDHLDGMSEQCRRRFHPLPRFHMTAGICNLEDLETWVTPADFVLDGYIHDDPIKYDMAV